MDLGREKKMRGKLIMVATAGYLSVYVLWEKPLEKLKLCPCIMCTIIVANPNYSGNAHTIMDVSYFTSIIPIVWLSSKYSENYLKYCIFMQII